MISLVLSLIYWCDIVGDLFFYILTLYRYTWRVYAMEICQKKKQLTYQKYLRWVFQLIRSLLSWDMLSVLFASHPVPI